MAGSQRDQDPAHDMALAPVRGGLGGDIQAEATGLTRPGWTPHAAPWTARASEGWEPGDQRVTTGTGPASAVLTSGELADGTWDLLTLSGDAPQGTHVLETADIALPLARNWGVDGQQRQSGEHIQPLAVCICVWTALVADLREQGETPSGGHLIRMASLHSAAGQIANPQWAGVMQGSNSAMAALLSPLSGGSARRWDGWDQGAQERFVMWWRLHRHVHALGRDPQQAEAEQISRALREPPTPLSEWTMPRAPELLRRAVRSGLGSGTEVARAGKERKSMSWHWTAPRIGRPITLEVLELSVYGKQVTATRLGLSREETEAFL